MDQSSAAAKEQATAGKDNPPPAPADTKPAAGTPKVAAAAEPTAAVPKGPLRHSPEDRLSRIEAIVTSLHKTLARLVANDGGERSPAVLARLEEGLEKLTKPPAPPTPERKKPWRNPQTLVLAGLGLVQVILCVVILLLLPSPAPVPLGKDTSTDAQFLALREDIAKGKGDVSRLDANERLAKLDDRLSKLEAAINRLNPLPPIVRQPLPQLDVMVLALNSRNLNLADYKDAFEGLFNDFKRDHASWDPQGNCRLGFYVAQTEQVDAHVALDNPMITFGTFDILAPGNDITERLSAIGPRVLAHFNKSRPNRRCLIVASARCVPPGPADNGWKDLAAVDAILIAPAGEAGPAADLMKKWESFCGPKKGTVNSLVRPAGAQSLATNVLKLRKRLRTLALPAPARQGQP